jgi:3',5'-cyclic AMP phosphodiesterase CpdA
MILAQISDLHVKPRGRLAYEAVDTAAFLRRAIARLNAFRPAPDLVIATGDLTDAGTPEEYDHLRELLAALEMPYALVVGNHDAREPLRAAFARDERLPATGPLQYVLETPVRVIVLDSQREGKEGGELDAERLTWLDDQLERRRTPTILALHHPPFLTGFPLMDDKGFAGRAQFEALVARHPNVERVICGHLHRSMFVRWAGTLASICPSTAHQLEFALDRAQPERFVMEPPAFHLHRWDGRRLITDVIPLAEPGPARPFRRDGTFIG